MNELTIEEKARAYDEAIVIANDAHKDEDRHLKATLERIFPQLKESEDERIRKNLLYVIEHHPTLPTEEVEEYIAWLEKQKVLTTEEELQSKEDVLWCIKQAQKYAKDENEMGTCWFAENWLEKQSENNKPLYIRFGDIPKDEKSKIYNGEIEIGTEKGVSVYHAFEDSDGNIVLGLSLPITKTSLYTQQHLLEYDNRACYLVSGDYVGKGTDGEPLLRNVKIVREIKDFRVKQGEQKPIFEMKTPEESLGIDSDTYNKIVDECIYGEQKPADITEKLKEEYRKGWDAAMLQLPKEVDSQIWQIANNAAKTWEESFAILCATQKAYDKGKKDALKEQKPAVIIPKFRVGDEIKTSNEEPLTITKIDKKGYWSNDLFICGFGSECIWDLVPADWSEEDKEICLDTIKYLELFDAQGIHGNKAVPCINWLKSLKDRVQPQLKQEWSEEDEKIFNDIVLRCEKYGYKEQIDWLKSLRPQK